MSKIKEEKFKLTGVDLECELIHIPDKEGRFVSSPAPDQYIVQIAAGLGTHKCILRTFCFSDPIQGKTLKENNHENAMKARSQWEQLKLALQR